MLSRRSFYCLAMLMALPAIMSAVGDSKRPEIKPMIPTADRSSGGRVFLEHADLLHKQTSDSFMVLTGNVVFTKGPMTMRCDSAHYFTGSESLDAFGNVSMEQGDTLFVFADILNYHGPTEVATLYAEPGKKVELINRDVKLETDVFVYDLVADRGYYEVGGRLTDPSNTLISQFGEYWPSTKAANFFTDVHLNSRDSKDTLDIYSDTLYYNTETHIAELQSPSRVLNSRGTIYTTLGVYDTDSSRATLYERSTIVTSQNQVLTADTIYYDRTAGFGEAWGNMVMTDSSHNVELRAQYGYYDEVADSSFITGRAVMAEYSGEDTLFLHGRYIETFRRIDSTEIKADTLAGIEAGFRLDTTHVAVAYPRVRFFRSDIQGVCDSMRFTDADTILRMFVNPVLWNEEQQIFGNVIEMHLNDSTLEWAKLPEQGFAAQHIEGEHYQQISGKEMLATFEAGEMRRLDINGNVEIIMYPEENDSTINKIVNAESSFLTAFFKGRATESVKMWPQTTGTATPLFLARPALYYLPKFKWFGEIRPRSKNDIFIVPAEMERIMREAGREIVIKSFVPRVAQMDFTDPVDAYEAGVPEPDASSGKVPSRVAMKATDNASDIESEAP